MVKRLDKFRFQSLAVAGDSTRWIYNFRVHQRASFLGIKFWKLVHAHAYTFPRYTNSPRVDGMSGYHAQLREQWL